MSPLVHLLQERKQEMSRNVQDYFLLNLTGKRSREGDAIFKITFEMVLISVSHPLSSFLLNSKDFGGAKTIS